MNWFKTFNREYDGTTYHSPKYYWKPNDRVRSYEIYQAPYPYEHVFLGSAQQKDIREAEYIAGQAICKKIDVRNMPELPLWSEEDYESVKESMFWPNVEMLLNAIKNNKCPVYVHCAYGISRSVSVLAAALSILTGKDVNSILNEMKKVRGMVGPHDVYYLMALEASGASRDIIEDLKDEFNIIDY